MTGVVVETEMTSCLRCGICVVLEADLSGPSHLVVVEPDVIDLSHQKVILVTVKPAVSKSF